VNLIPAGDFTSVSGQLSRKTVDMEGAVLLVCGDLGGTGFARNTISNAIALQEAGFQVISLSGGVLAQQLGDIPLTLLQPARSKSRWLSFVEVARRLRAEISRRPSPIVTVSMVNQAYLRLWLSLVGDHLRGGSIGSATTSIIAAAADFRAWCAEQRLAWSQEMQTLYSASPSPWLYTRPLLVRVGVGAAFFCRTVWTWRGCSRGRTSLLFSVFRLGRR
jgi:hypothetical protein